LESAGGHQFDVLEVREPEMGETAKVYFNIDLHTQRLPRTWSDLQKWRHPTAC